MRFGIHSGGWRYVKNGLVTEFSERLEVKLLELSRKLVVIGAGGHAKVVIESAERSGLSIAGVIDDRLGASVFEYASLGLLGNVAFEADWQAVIAIGSNSVRAKIARSLEGQVSWGSVLDPQAMISARALVQSGTVVFAGAVVQADARIGHHVILNTGCRVDHDVQIADYCHVAPGAILTGGVALEEGVFVGAGAVVLPGVRIGAWSTLGAGSVATKDLSSEQVFVGSPARLR
jgi:sugar O-acyltransferase (sialic acid O-acetyltransferase NeuD family)